MAAWMLHGGCVGEEAGDCDCQQIFSILALVIFLSKFLLKSASKSCFFSLWRRHASFGVAVSGVIM